MYWTVFPLTPNPGPFCYSPLYLATVGAGSPKAQGRADRNFGCQVPPRSQRRLIKCLDLIVGCFAMSRSHESLQARVCSLTQWNGSSRPNCPVPRCLGPARRVPFVHSRCCCSQDIAFAFAPRLKVSLATLRNNPRQGQRNGLPELPCSQRTATRAAAGEPAKTALSVTASRLAISIAGTFGLGRRTLNLRRLEGDHIPSFSCAEYCG